MFNALYTPYLRMTFAILISIFSGISEALSETTAPPGWEFNSVTESSNLRSHPDQIGRLQETKTPSEFLTVPVIKRKSVGLSARPGRAQLERLEKEMRAFLHDEKRKPNSKSARLEGDRPVIEIEFGKSGSGLKWFFATVKNDQILILVTDSRLAKPGANVKPEFFRMAREFTSAY